MTMITIFDPCDVWAQGSALILGAAGYDVEIAADVPGRGDFQTADTVTFIARSLLPHFILQGGSGKAGVSRAKIIAVLHARDNLSLAELASSGLSGVLLGSSSRESLLDCVHSVEQNDRWIDPHFPSWPAPSKPVWSNWLRLSDREAEVASLAAKGLSNKSIALALKLSDRTVKVHIHHIFTKLGVQHRSELVITDRLVRLDGQRA